MSFLKIVSTSTEFQELFERMHEHDDFKNESLVGYVLHSRSRGSGGQIQVITSIKLTPVFPCVLGTELSREPHQGKAGEVGR